MQKRIRGPQTAAATCLLALAALVTWRVSDDSAAVFFYALPVLVAALVLTWQEAVATIFDFVGGLVRSE